MRLNVELAKMLMNLFPAEPIAPTRKVGHLQEVFQHPYFINASEDVRKKIMLESSMYKYRQEQDYPWDNYFGEELRYYLEGSEALDLGCFNGGRSVAWYERYRLRRICGIDVDPIYAKAAALFAERRGVNGVFLVGKGEALPFDDSSFDAILSFDVLEHVENVSKTIKECYRVLKKGGMLFVVFPGYWHPREHHLSLVTRTPFLHYVFSGHTLIRAMYEIIQDRGEEAYWYRRKSPKLEPWERLHTINGTTYREFRRMIRDNNWRVVLHSSALVGAVGKEASKWAILKPLFRTIGIAAKVPLFAEVLLHRIVYILEKR